jgi:hypothetical protein
MATAAEQSRIVHDLLESVERDSQQSQRSRASEFGIALGLVNAYLKYCIRKGYIRVRKVPMRRYVYFLTPKGFAEKSRLSLMLISNSLLSFRLVRSNYCDAFEMAKARGWKRVALAGMSELAEIASLCALEKGVTLLAIVAPSPSVTQFGNLPVVSSFEDIPEGCDGAVLTDLTTPDETFRRTVSELGVDRVLVPPILGIGAISPGATEQ